MTRFRVGHCAQLVSVQKCIQTSQPCGAVRLKNVQAVGILLSRPDPGVDRPKPVSRQLLSDVFSFCLKGGGTHMSRLWRQNKERNQRVRQAREQLATSASQFWPSTKF